jgi:proteic killer suppression protein
MIRSFRCRETERIFRGGVSPVFPPDIQTRARRKLVLLDDAVDLNDLRQTPGNRLEALKGDRAGQNSIRINDQWRICFIWDEGAEEVEIVDYH